MLLRIDLHQTQTFEQVRLVVFLSLLIQLILRHFLSVLLSFLLAMLGKVHQFLKYDIVYFL